MPYPYAPPSFLPSLQPPRKQDKVRRKPSKNRRIRLRRKRAAGVAPDPKSPQPQHLDQIFAKRSKTQKRNKRKLAMMEQKIETLTAQAAQSMAKIRGGQECGICMEFLDPVKGNRRYGLLDCCDHVFCETCIKSWRKEKILDPFGRVEDTKKDCPFCRRPSSYLVPSVKSLTSQEKQELFDRRLKQKAEIECVFFKRSLRGANKRKDLLSELQGGESAQARPWCPFYDDCHHSHQVTPDSPPYLFNKRAEKYNRRSSPSRPRSNPFEFLMMMQFGAFGHLGYFD